MRAARPSSRAPARPYREGSGPTDAVVMVYIQGLGRVPTTKAKLYAWQAYLNSPAGKEWARDLTVQEQQGLEILGLR